MSLDSVFKIALHDLKRWRKMPLTAACALIPPIAITLVLVTLSLAVTQQPVALVIQGNGPESMRMVQIIKSDAEAYDITITNATTANSMLQDEKVAAIITIPSTFDEQVANGTGKVLLTINNVDFDFSDDIRRSVDRSIVEFDAPALISDELVNTSLPNAYHVALDEQYIRETNVDWFHYQFVPTFVLLVLNVGLVGTACLCALDGESKTARMLAMSPQSSWLLVSGRILGGVFACFAIVLPAVLLGATVGFISLPINQLPALFGIFLGTAFCASGIGAIIGTLIKGSRYVAFLSSIIAIYLFLIGGGFTTIELVPHWLQNLSAFIPTRYSIDALRQALFYPNPTGLPFSLLVLAISAIAFVGVGAFLMRRSWTT
ncbi:MAG TPA: ABC transporter permease [Candidatus Nanoarchaeia archaeon]|nr:ABC transporter permease [Candidatus Nanoarchaeia archaeon]